MDCVLVETNLNTKKSEVSVMTIGKENQGVEEKIVANEIEQKNQSESPIDGELKQICGNGYVVHTVSSEQENVDNASESKEVEISETAVEEFDTQTSERPVQREFEIASDISSIFEAIRHLALGIEKSFDELNESLATINDNVVNAHKEVCVGILKTNENLAKVHKELNNMLKPIAENQMKLVEALKKPKKEEPKSDIETSLGAFNFFNRGE